MPLNLVYIKCLKSGLVQVSDTPNKNFAPNSPALKRPFSDSSLVHLIINKTGLNLVSRWCKNWSLRSGFVLMVVKIDVMVLMSFKAPTTKI